MFSAAFLISLFSGVLCVCVRFSHHVGSHRLPNLGFVEPLVSCRLAAGDYETGFS
jgi:hypothetical protein